MSLAKTNNMVDLDTAIKIVPNPLLIIDKDYNIKFANQSAELLFSESISHNHKNLKNILPKDNVVFSLIDQIVNLKYSATQYDVFFTSLLKKDPILVDINASIFKENFVILSIHKRAMAEQIDRSTAQRGITHSMSGLSSLLAHEIKNPLSGIKGAAQLLGENASEEDKDLT